MRRCRKRSRHLRFPQGMQERPTVRAAVLRWHRKEQAGPLRGMGITLRMPAPLTTILYPVRKPALKLQGLSARARAL